MSLEKEKFIGVVRPVAISKRDDKFINNIQHEILLAKDELKEIFHQSTKIIPNNFTLPEINIKDILGDNHVQIISDNVDKKKFCLIIFNNFIPNDVNINWVINNEIRFIIEYIVADTDVFWEESSNNYSARVNGRINELKEIFLDIFMDTIIEDSLLKNDHFRHLFQNKSLFNIIHSKNKINFINNNYHVKVNKNLNYYPFATLFRNSNEERYDVKNLLFFWQKYLFDIIGQANDMHKVSSIEDIIKLIPRKFHGQINYSNFSKTFLEKCKNSGIYLYVWLVKSPIGSPAKVIKQIDSIFKGKPKRGKFTIIPLSFAHRVNSIEHLILTGKFEKI